VLSALILVAALILGGGPTVGDRWALSFSGR